MKHAKMCFTGSIIPVKHTMVMAIKKCKLTNAIDHQSSDYCIRLNVFVYAVKTWWIYPQ